MMSKDQMIGGAILAICVIVAVGYLVLVSVPSVLGIAASTARLDAVLILVSIAFIAILGIGGWIGYTMATTPPPKPIEEITAEPEKENETAKPQTET
jgi:predicted DNA-binding transcriptional regulator